MKDLISRQAAIEIIQNMYPGMPRVPWLLKDWQKRYEPYIRTENAIRELPSAQPDIIRCKDCEHWKDSDGVYRRGFGAESKCPINLQSVYDGTFYCGMAERRQDVQNKT